MKSQKEIAEYEQKIQAAVSTVKEIRGGVYSVPSSRPGVYPQVITTDENGNANYCSCEGFTYCKHCYHCQAVTRFVAAQQAIAQAEAVIAEAAKTPEEIQIETWIAQGVDRETATRVASAKGRKPVAYKGALNGPREFSLFK